MSAEDWNTEPALPAYSLNDIRDAEGVKAIEESIDSLDAELRQLSIKIHGKSVRRSMIVNKTYSALYMQCRPS